MAEVNKITMGLFPEPEETSGFLKRSEAIPLLRRTLEAARGAVDQITEGSERVLSEDEQVKLGEISEEIAAYAGDVALWDTSGSKT